MPTTPPPTTAVSTIPASTIPASPMAVPSTAVSTATVPTTVVHRVVGAMLVRDGQILLGHRTAGRAVFPDVWDLAGGHIEPGETAAQAMVRECREELGIEIAPPAEPLDRWQGDTFDLTAFRIVDWAGEVTNCAVDEHDRLAWFTPEDTLRLDLAHERYRRLFAAEAASQLSDLS